jgi:hypothetical protein
MYNTEELMLLPTKEKIALAEALWGSVEEEMLSDSKEDMSFAEERLALHKANSAEGYDINTLKKHFSEKYGF